MPLKTLASLGIECGIHTGPDSIRHSDSAALAAMNVIAFASEVDCSIGKALGAVLGLESLPALTIYNQLRSSDRQREAASAVIKIALPEKYYIIFKAIVNIVRDAFDIRNKIAHYSWGFAKEIPDSLLLIEQGYQVSLHNQAMNMIHNRDLANPPCPDHNKIYVVNEMELAPVLEEFRTAVKYLALFCVAATLYKATASDFAFLTLERDEFLCEKIDSLKKNIKRGSRDNKK
jgi:hypothetical protein